jgi:ADP-ribosyl-[dinitrogen reductase] hydrolase
VGWSGYEDAVLHRFRNCLLAGACGDALGAPVEFMSLELIRRRFGDQGIKDLDVAYDVAGAITDDTQMTLFTCEALVQWADDRSKSIEDHLREAYLLWLDTQTSSYDASLVRGALVAGHPALWARRAPGNSCLMSLRNLREGQPPVASKGCGAVMRVAPVGLALGPDEAWTVGMHSARITHDHLEGWLPASALACLVSLCTNGMPLVSAVQEVGRRLKADFSESHTYNLWGQACESAQSPQEAPQALFDVWGGGWTGPDALAIAVFAVLAYETLEQSLEEAVILAANHRGDTDSTASIAGQILGAAGQEPPARWVSALEMRDVIEQAGDVLFDRFGAVRSASPTAL